MTLQALQTYMCLIVLVYFGFWLFWMCHFCLNDRSYQPIACCWCICQLLGSFPLDAQNMKVSSPTSLSVLHGIVWVHHGNVKFVFGLVKFLVMIGQTYTNTHVKLFSVYFYFLVLFKPWISRRRCCCAPTPTNVWLLGWERLGGNAWLGAPGGAECCWVSVLCDFSQDLLTSEEFWPTLTVTWWTERRGRRGTRHRKRCTGKDCSG